VQDQGWQWPGGGARDHARHQRHSQPDPRGQGGADVFIHPDRQQRRYANAGPEPDRSGAPQRDQRGGSAHQGQNPGKLSGLTGKKISCRSSS